MDNWVNGIARDLLEVPHLHITLTTEDLLWPFFCTERSLLRVLLKMALQAIRELLDKLYPGVRVGLVYTVHTAGCDLALAPTPIR